MELSQAYAILGLNNKESYQNDDILETCEDAVFKENTFFIRRTFLPKLAQKRIKRLEDLSAAAQLLEVNFESRSKEYVAQHDFHEIDTLLSLLNTYHTEESNLKTALVNVVNPSEASAIYKDWIVLFEHFSAVYIQLFEKIVNSCEVELSDIKVSELIDHNDLLQELKNNEYGKLASKEYFRLKKLTK